jgi:asparagine synthase (glutamine-hydrolysing)
VYKRQPLISAVKKNKSRVILSGMGGDEFFSGTGQPYLDYLQKGYLLPLIKELSFQCEKKGARQGLKRFGVNIAWPLVPPFLRYILTKGRAKRNIPEWLTNNFVSRTNLATRIHSFDPRLLLSNLGRLSHARIMLNAREQYSLETLDRCRAFQQVEVRHPFLDQRIAEFAISLPDYENQKHDQIKHLFRDNCNYLLPQLTRNRQDKAEFSYIANQTFQQTLFKLRNNRSLALVKMGWVDSEGLDNAISRKIDMISKNKYISGQKSWELWFAFSINLWCDMLLNSRLIQR